MADIPFRPLGASLIGSSVTDYANQILLLNSGNQIYISYRWKII